MKSFLRLALIPALVFVAACSHSKPRLKEGVMAEGEVVVAEGMAPFNGDDLPATKAVALAAAQKAAVELVVGVYVNAKTRVEKAVAIEQKILTQTEGYVKRYEILSEGRDGAWYKMKIRALVTTQKLRSDLEELGTLRQPGVGNPRVALAIQEWVGEKRQDGGSATRVLTQGLLNKGFRIVSLPASLTNMDDPADMARTMTRGSAEIVVAGLARAQSLGYTNKELGGMSSYRANLTFRVLEVGTGEVITTVSQTASGMEATPELSASKSLENAAEAAVKDLSTLPSDLQKRSQVEVTITGLKSFEVLSALQKGLAKQTGISDLFLRSYAQENGIAVLSVYSDLSAQEVADSCVRIGGDAWSVYKVTGRSVQLSATLAGR